MFRFLYSLLLFLQPEICPGQYFSIEQRNFAIPLVKEKENVSLVRVKVTPRHNDDGFSFLKEVALDFNGTDRLSDIHVVKVYCNADSNYLAESNALNAALFSSEDEAAINKNSILLKGNLRLNNGVNYIWISVSAKKSAHVGNQVSINLSGLNINGVSVNIPKLSPGIFRIAGAVRLAKQDNINTSRIPGLATATNGDLLAIYDARYNSRRDLQGDIDIALSRSADKGNTWQPPQFIIDMKQWGGLPEKFNGVSDGCILVDKKTGHIFVAGLWMHGVLNEEGKWIEGLSDTSSNWNHQWKSKGSQPGFDVKQTSQFLVVKSTDNGKTWSEPVNLTRMCKKEEWWLWAPAPGSGFTMSDGTLVFPTQGRDKTGKAFSNITYSKDGGKTWRTSNPASDLSTTECIAAQLSDGSVMLNMRTNANKGVTGEGNGRAVAVTNDLGKTWTMHKTSRNALPEPVCMASLYKHEYIAKDGSKKSVLLFVNPNSKTKRNNITLKVSYDDGNSWPPEKFILLDELGGSGYSCITSVDNDTIGIIYEGSQAHLIFEKINLNKILN